MRSIDPVMLLAGGFMVAMGIGLATKAEPQNFPDNLPAYASTGMGGDALEIEKHGPYGYMITYDNSEGETSVSGSHEVTLDAFTVRAVILIGGKDKGFAETIILYPPEGYVAIPDSMDVLDGEVGHLLVTIPMF